MRCVCRFLFLFSPLPFSGILDYSMRIRARPTRFHENKLHAEGYFLVAGIDEAGKGAWAGPLVAACVMLPKSAQISGLRDSKQLSPSKREELYVSIVRQAIAWSVGIVEHHVIDRIGIVKANQRVMEDALRKMPVEPEYVLIDGVPFWEPPYKHAFVVKGDQSVFSIAAASVLAKVTRDRLMHDLHRQCPEYGFAEHKGYGTKQHREKIRRHGLSPVHRHSYRLSL